MHVACSHGYFFDVNIGWPGKVHDTRVSVHSSFYCKENGGQLLPDSKRTLNVGRCTVTNLGRSGLPSVTLVNESISREWRFDTSTATFQLPFEPSEYGGRELLWKIEGEVEVFAEKNGLL